MKKTLSYAIAAASLLAGLSALSIPMVFADSSSGRIAAIGYKDREMTIPIEYKIEKYSVNANGQTYGAPGDSPYVEDLPDLMLVVGDNGKEGYVYKDEFLKHPETIEEIQAYMASLENGTYVPAVYNVYAADGVTVIDTFTETLSQQN